VRPPGVHFGTGGLDGRCLADRPDPVGALFLAAAAGHLTQTKALAGYAAARGVPLATPATLVTGVQILVGGLSVILGVWADLGALLLAAFLLPTAVLMHGFWRETDPTAKQMEMNQFSEGRCAGRGGACVLLDVPCRSRADAHRPTVLRRNKHFHREPAHRRETR
jgi:putative oxidoreductase